MARESQRAQDVDAELVPGPHERVEQLAVGCRVGPETVGRSLDRAFHDYGRAVIERVRQRCGRMDPFQAMVGQRQRGKEGRARRQRMDRRADVVKEPR